MSKLWELLAEQTPAIGTSPVLQVAADGQWEQAEILPIGDDVEAAHAAVMRTAAVAKYVAMEVLWPGTMFVGTAWPADRQAEALAAATRVFAALGGERQSDAMTGLMALLDGIPDGEIESADLGAVNAWMSVGPQPLWRRDETYAAEAVRSAVADRPNLMTCTHPVAAEFSIRGARGCWVAIFVSTPSAGAHHLDLRRLDHILATVVGPAACG